MNKICIAVVTYKRPQLLARCIEGIVRQTYDLTGATIRIIDNDPEFGARATVEAYAARFTQLVFDYVALGSQNISEARNVAIERCEHPLLLFIDDDDLPQPDWVASLVGCQARFESAAVISAVKIKYERPHCFVARSGMMQPSNPETGRERNIVYHTSGSLLSMDFVAQRKLRFALGFGLTGSEDTHFFLQMNFFKGKVVWCREAVIEVNYCTERCRLLWALKRAVYSSTNFARARHLWGKSQKETTSYFFLRQLPWILHKALYEKEVPAITVANVLRTMGFVIGAGLYDYFGLSYVWYGEQRGFIRISKTKLLGKRRGWRGHCVQSLRSAFNV